MVFKICYLFITAIFLSIQSFAQSSETVTYLGIINVTNVGKFSYQLTYKADGNKISGTTITEEGNKNETKTFIAGRINNDGSVEFSESKVLKTRVKDKNTSFCMVKAKLSKHSKLGLEILEGSFRGTDIKGEFCGSGSISLAKKVNTIPDSLKNAIVSTLKNIQNEGVIKDGIKPLSEKYVNKIYCNETAVKVRFYDSGYLDADEISIKYNDKDFASKYELTKDGRIFLFNIEKDSKNIISVRTLNEGLSSPNTATLDVMDNKGKIDTYQLNAPANTEIAIQLVKK